MPELKIKFDRHGLGDVVHFAHAVQLYKSRGYDVTVQVEENKKFLWQVAGVTIVQGGDLPDHSYHYPAHFEDLNAPDSATNKVAFGLRHDVMPKLELTEDEAWDELCSVRLSAHDHIPPEAHAEAAAFLEGLPRPIICLHSRGTNWHERKSIPTEVAFDLILKLLDQTGGSVVVLDYDRRAPMVGDERCKGIKPSWGHIPVERLCALLERTDLLIGIDSGPFHVAALTGTKSLGVFRSLHPNRVCLPNPNAVYLVSDQYAEHWEARRDKWNLAMYTGAEPSADDIAENAVSLLNCDQASKAVTMNSDRENFAGRYQYYRVGHDRRFMRLESDGTISEGAEGCEQRWSVSGDTISISGKDGVICRCTFDGKIYKGRWTQFEKMPIELIPVENEVSPNPADNIAGEYFCELIGSREFPISLGPYGDVESEWFTAWERTGTELILCRDEQRVTLHCDPDGCWRGDRIELIKASRQPFRSFGKTEPIKYRRHEYLYTTVAEFSRQCMEFARSLPPVRAIAGVPRSGLLAASLMATELNCPMIPIESLLDGDIPEIPVPRRGRGARFDADGMILVVDDNCSSGRVISTLRPQLHPDVKIAVILGNDKADFTYQPIIRDVHQSYEWTILHDDKAEYTLTDMDGVLCEDWTGGSESNNLAAYERFLKTAKPRRIPSYPLLGIVTNRMECYRQQTEEWLDRHGIQYRDLVMSPYPTFQARDSSGDAASRKAAVYEECSDARLFIESCGKQAREIKRLTGRPVLSIEDNCLV